MPGLSPRIAGPRAGKKTRRRERLADAGTNDGAGTSAPTRVCRSCDGPTPEVRAFATGALHSAAGAWRKQGKPAGPTARARASAAFRAGIGNRVGAQRESASFIGRVRVRDRTQDACCSNCPTSVPPGVFNGRHSRRWADRGRTTPLVIGASRAEWPLVAPRRQDHATDVGVGCAPSPTRRGSGARARPRGRSAQRAPNGANRRNDQREDDAPGEHPEQDAAGGGQGFVPRRRAVEGDLRLRAALAELSRWLIVEHDAFPSRDATWPAHPNALSRGLFTRCAAGRCVAGLVAGRRAGCVPHVDFAADSMTCAASLQGMPA
jgi:hypothetical protein